jgi:hypothetical protein
LTHKILVPFISLMFLISSCTKKEDVIIPNNVPPADHTIDSTTLEIYLNKVYVNLLGREPIGNEKHDALVILRQDNFAVSSRKQFLETLFSKPEYKQNLYTVANHEYLHDLDSTEIAGQITQFNYLLTQPQYAPFYSILNYEVGRMELLKVVPNELHAGTLDYRGMLQRICNNYFYDQINMGTENFVVSTFQNFLFRYPTDAELLSGKTMVDGNNAVIFFQSGKTKNDYVNIFFTTDDYYEGQVRNAFTKYLFREPTSAEIPFYASFYRSNDSYQLLQKEIFALDEYAGVNQ